MRMEWRVFILLSAGPVITIALLWLNLRAIDRLTRLVTASMAEINELFARLGVRNGNGD